MQRQLSSYSKESLVKQICDYCSEKGIRGPDRLSLRIKDALVCFYCEVAPDFPRGLPPLMMSARLTAAPRKNSSGRMRARQPEELGTATEAAVGAEDDHEDDDAGMQMPLSGSDGEPGDDWEDPEAWVWISME
jgi:hypothetical protein